LVVYPSAGPETFSYTLSEAWSAGVPVLVPPIGALAERVTGSGAGYVMSETEWRDERSMIARCCRMTAMGSSDALREAGVRARSIAHATLAGMADATFALYDSAIAHAAPLPPPDAMDRARVRDALGYVDWKPPSLAPSDEPSTLPAEPIDAELATRVARAALAIRHTALGRMLYRVTPQALRAALKSRLAP
jgi:hypothetical protein